MAKTYLEFRDASSSKFWEISVEGNSHTVRFGKIGTDGQSKTKKFKSPELAKKDADDLTASKTKKGYAPTSAGKASSAKSEKSQSTGKSGGMAALVEELITATLPTVDPEMRTVERRPPATAAQIAALEKTWERPLPPSYRAFLEVTNGLDGDAFTHRLLGTEDQKWANKQVDSLAQFWDEDEFDRSKMFLLAVPEAGSGIRNLAAFGMGKGTELPVIDWDIGSELERFKSFEAYLRDRIELSRQVEKSHAAEEKKANAHAKKVAGGKEALASGAAIAKSGPSRDAAFEAIFELDDVKSIASAVERLVAAKPSARELERYMERVSAENSRGTKEGFARAELVFHPDLDVPSSARERWTRLVNNTISRAFATKDKKRSERWSDVARPFVRKNMYLGHNLACAYVAVGRIDDAFEMCKAAVEIGYRQTADMRVDKDLGKLLKEPRFQALFGQADKTDANARTSVPRNAALEAPLVAWKSPTKLAEWMKGQSSPLAVVMAADVAADQSPHAKKTARARFDAYKKEVLDKAFPLLAKFFVHHLDKGYFTFHYGLLEKLDSFQLNTPKERAEVMALLADPHATFVKYLTLRGAKLGDLSLYTRHPALRRIEHRWTDITQVESLEPLAGLSELRALDLRKSKVKDLRPIAKLPLVQLYLDKSAVTDLVPLAKHPTLSHLTLDGTKVKDLSPLFSCPKLAAISLYDVKVDKAQLEKLSTMAKARKPDYDDACMDGYRAGVRH